MGIVPHPSLTCFVNLLWLPNTSQIKIRNATMISEKIDDYRPPVRGLGLTARQRRACRLVTRAHTGEGEVFFLDSHTIPTT